SLESQNRDIFDFKLRFVINNHVFNGQVSHLDINFYFIDIVLTRIGLGNLLPAIVNIGFFWAINCSNVRLISKKLTKTPGTLIAFTYSTNR
ncbi:hypothetical protein DLR65_01730, partial [Vibrio tarriae]